MHYQEGWRLALTTDNGIAVLLNQFSQEGLQDLTLPLRYDLLRIPSSDVTLAAWKQKKRDSNALEERRRNAVQLMLKGDVQRTELAESLRVSYTSIKNWWNMFEDNGNSLEALSSKKREGRRPRMNRQQLRRLERMLLEGPMKFGFETDLWTTERVASLIEEKFGIKYHPDHVRKILHNSLGFTPQKPEGVARERDERKRTGWIKLVLPEIKKS